MEAENLTDFRMKEQNLEKKKKLRTETERSRVEAGKIIARLFTF